MINDQSETISTKDPRAQAILKVAHGLFEAFQELSKGMDTSSAMNGITVFIADIAIQQGHDVCDRRMLEMVNHFTSQYFMLRSQVPDERGAPS